MNKEEINKSTKKFMNKKFISKSNRVLRKVLNSEENLDIIQDFIETFLKIEIQEICLNSYLKIKSNYLPAEENFGIADVRIKTKEQKEQNIGIQFIDGYYVQNKMLLYYVQVHSNQCIYQDKRKITSTVTINLLDRKYLKSNQYFNKITIPSKTERNYELYVIELPKFIVNEKERISKQEAWMLYLCGKEQKQIAEVLKKFDKIKKLDKQLEEYWKNEKME